MIKSFIRRIILGLKNYKSLNFYKNEYKSAEYFIFSVKNVFIFDK